MKNKKIEDLVTETKETTASEPASQVEPVSAAADTNCVHTVSLEDTKEYSNSLRELMSSINERQFKAGVKERIFEAVAARIINQHISNGGHDDAAFEAKIFRAKRLAETAKRVYFDEK